MKNTKIICIFAIIATVSACSTTDPNKRTKQAAAAGAIAGAVLGHQVKDGKGKYIGAVLGGLAGAGIGNYMDKQQQELEAALERERQNGLEIQRLENNAIKLHIPSEISFAFDSANVTPGFRPTLDQISNILNRYPQTTVDIIGHTDSTGSDSYNLDLSQRRATSVANYFSSQGVSMQRLVTTGAGETQPRSNNQNEASRQLNRRVEIIIRPDEQSS